MDTILKILLSVAVLGWCVLAGFRVHVYLNARVQESNTWWGLAGSILLLFAAHGALFVGGLMVMLKLYQLLAA
ncbi:MAG: hypothetical protein JWP27_1579 [Flaviaesturariibacter sp.]|nr:hypothetical protein [Flaviaesturariibacter sp.]